MHAGGLNGCMLVVLTDAWQDRAGATSSSQQPHIQNLLGPLCVSEGKSCQVNFICRALNQSYGLKGLNRPYMYDTP